MNNDINFVNSANVKKCKCCCNSNGRCNGGCGINCQCKEDKNFVSFNDNNYAIYRFEEWDNNYKINILGIDNEIPANEITKNQSLKIMDEIRSYNFNYKEKEINGMVAIAINFNDNLFNEDIDQLIAIEEQEYEDMKNELYNLDLEDSNDFVKLNNDKFLIYKLYYREGGVLSRPANYFTRKHSSVEISKIKLSVSQEGK